MYGNWTLRLRDTLPTGQRTDFVIIYEITIFLHILTLLTSGRVYLIMLSILTLNLFTACLDRFWANQDVKHDFTAELTGIGDRSVYEICQTVFFIHGSVT